MFRKLHRCIARVNMATSVSRTFSSLSRLIGQSRWYSSTGSSSGGKAQDKSGQKTEQITTKPVAEAGIKANKKEHQSRINSTGKGFEDTTYMAKEYYRNGLFSFYDIEFDMQKSRLKQPSSLKKTA